MAHRSDHMFTVAAVALCVQLDVLSRRANWNIFLVTFSFSSLRSFCLEFYFSYLGSLETQGVCHEQRTPHFVFARNRSEPPSDSGSVQLCVGVGPIRIVKQSLLHCVLESRKHRSSHRRDQKSLN
jgi:hypothetical protein